MRAFDMDQIEGMILPAELEGIPQAGHGDILPAGNRAENHKRLSSRRDSGGKGCIGRFVREIFLADEEPHEGATLER